MPAARRAPTKECGVCKRAVQNSFICRRCGKELRDLLIGSKDPRREERGLQHGEAGAGQPGIVWYIEKLSETAYRQTKIERSQGTKSSRAGYDQLGDRRAVDLLAKIGGTLGRWDGDLMVLLRKQKPETASTNTLAPRVDFDALNQLRAKRLADHIPQLRHNCEGLESLHTDLLAYAKTAFGYINRPDDVCCGQCSNYVADKENPTSSKKVECGAWLYAEEFEDSGGKRITADTVQCPKCRKKYDTAALRDGLKQQTKQMLFTGPELLKLMETSLNDRMPKSSFYQLIKDGRLQPRGYDGSDAPMYTYADVCDAREKPTPTRKKKNARVAS